MNMGDSYKKVCTAETESDDDDGEEEEDWWSNGRWVQWVTVEQTARGPNVIVPPEMKAKLAKRWELSLFVKLLGCKTNAECLGNKLQQTWGRLGLVKTMDIGGAGFFLVSFKSKDDYTFALTGGPWIIQDHYLAVQMWKEDFDPDDEKITTTIAWIRITKLAMEYYDKGILFVLGSQVGKVIELDMTRNKGRFARICVELDLNKPLLPCVLINGKEKALDYEGIHLICFSCGKYGHDVDHCRLKSAEPVTEGTTETPRMSEENLGKRSDLHVGDLAEEQQEENTEFTKVNNNNLGLNKNYKEVRGIGENKGNESREDILSLLPELPRMPLGPPNSYLQLGFYPPPEFCAHLNSNFPTRH